MAALSFGIKTAPRHTTYEEMLTVWREADEVPVFEHVWLFDHFAPIQGPVASRQGPFWALLEAYAVETRHVRLGLMVTGNTDRHPAVLAEIAATVDVITDGRLDFGIGVSWSRYEHSSLDSGFYPPGRRIRQFGEACELVRLLFTQSTVDYAGRHFLLEGAQCAPRPVQQPYPPFVVGGGGEQLTLRAVARYADVWTFGGGPVATFTHKARVLRQHCAAVGRDPSDIRLSAQLPVNPNALGETTENVQRFVGAGATHVILNLRPPYPEGICARLAEEVIPKIRA